MCEDATATGRRSHRSSGSGAGGHQQVDTAALFTSSRPRPPGERPAASPGTLKAEKQLLTDGWISLNGADSRSDGKQPRHATRATPALRSDITKTNGPEGTLGLSTSSLPSSKKPQIAQFLHPNETSLVPEGKRDRLPRQLGDGPA